MWFFRIFKQAGKDFVDDDAMTMSGAVAFYAALSLAPLLLVLVWALAFLGPHAQEQIMQQVVRQMGDQAGGAVSQILARAKQPRARSIAGVISILTLLFSATGVFAQVQYSLNRIWDVEGRSAVREWVRKRLLSLGLIIVIGILLLVAIGLSAAFAAMFGSWFVVPVLVALVVDAILFALIFRYFPDAEVSWRDVWVGAIATAILFAIGNFLIGLYLGRSGLSSMYGAAGSLIALLIWVYYSGIIFFYGAEVTQAWARAAGRRIVAEPGAEPTGKGRATEPQRPSPPPRRGHAPGHPGPAPA